MTQFHKGKLVGFEVNNSYLFYTNEIQCLQLQTTDMQLNN